MNTRLAVCLLTLLTTHGTLAAPRAEVTVFAAASLTNALQEIGAAYEQHGGPHVVFNFGASSTLARQIDEGAPADVFFSADETKMDGLAKHGEIVAETRRALLSNSLALVVAADSSLRFAGARDLLGPAVRILALAEPQSVPAGIYAKEYLQSAGVWMGVIDRIVPTENVRAALAAVEAGNADAAIVYKTDTGISSKVRIAYEVPVAEAPRISYPVAVLSHGRDLAEAKRFVDYLSSADSLAVFRRYGFLIPDAP